MGCQPGLAALLGASLQEAKAQGILIRQQALEYIGEGCFIHCSLIPDHYS